MILSYSNSYTSSKADNMSKYIMNFLLAVFFAVVVLHDVNANAEDTCTPDDVRLILYPISLSSFIHFSMIFVFIFSSTFLTDLWYTHFSV